MAWPALRSLMDNVAKYISKYFVRGYSDSNLIISIIASVRKECDRWGSDSIAVVASTQVVRRNLTREIDHLDVRRQLLSDRLPIADIGM